MLPVARKVFLLKLKQRVTDAKRIHALERKLGLSIEGHSLDYRISSVWGFRKVIPYTAAFSDYRFCLHIRTMSAREFPKQADPYAAHLSALSFRNPE